MKWSHLPVAGGLYDQDPRLLEGFRYIFAERSKYEAEKREEEEKKQAREMRRAGGRSPSRLAGHR